MSPSIYRLGVGDIIPSTSYQLSASVAGAGSTTATLEIAGELITGRFMDWATQTPDETPEQTEAHRLKIVDTVDGFERWTGNVGRRMNFNVVTAPASMPFAHWLQIEFIAGAGGNNPSLINDEFAPLDIGDIQDIRCYQRYTMPNTEEHNAHHGNGDGQGNSITNWSQNCSFREGDNDLWRYGIWFPGGSYENKDVYFGPWTPNRGDPEPIFGNTYSNDYPLAKADVYMICWKIKRVDTDDFWIKCWLYDATTDPLNPTLLLGPSGHLNIDNGSGGNSDKDMSMEVLTPINYLPGLGQLWFGHNGGPTTGLPAMFMDIGGVAMALNQLDDDTPLPAYGGVTDGVYTETPV